MDNKAMGLLTVNTVSRLANISAHSLRAWERRYNAVTPQRSPSGRRSYTVKDVERLRILKNLVDHGFTIGRIANLPDSELLTLVTQIQRTPEATKTNSSTPLTLPAPRQLSLSAQAEQSPWIRELLQDLLDYKLTQVAQHLFRARNQMAARSFVVEFISPLLAEVGHLSSIGELSVSQEHALSAILRDQISQLHVNLVAANFDGASVKMALATREGDLHEFGIILSNVLLRHHGISTHYFGANLPASALADAMNALKITHVVLGNTPLPPELEKVTLGEYIRELVHLVKHPFQIWVGGKNTQLNLYGPASDQVVLVPSLTDLDQMADELVATRLRTAGPT
ncbi:MAG: MerR family transcriptional regulator [Pseudobdellovibrionaceae bacterium]|nr:MerR family transcriptional regulator [Bdellovibrionales bacterium]USN48416.1 MAG: MerR family transcriptional regulator [Pseudobdellovibrionaceae bacterium]